MVVDAMGLCQVDAMGLCQVYPMGLCQVDAMILWEGELMPREIDAKEVNV